MRIDTLEDLIGDSGTVFQGALGFMVVDRSDSGQPPPQPGFGASIDDVVLEWREIGFAEDVWECTPGEPRVLAVDKDPATGDISVSYEPACSSMDNNLEFGLLEHVAMHQYSGHDCFIGNSGAHTFNLGPGDFFWLLVANDGAAFEGSYGRDAAGNERPEDLTDWECSFVQDLTGRCDAGTP